MALAGAPMEARIVQSDGTEHLCSASVELFTSGWGAARPGSHARRALGRTWPSKGAGRRHRFSAAVRQSSRFGPASICRPRPRAFFPGT